MINPLNPSQWCIYFSCVRVPGQSDAQADTARMIRYRRASATLQLAGFAIERWTNAVGRTHRPHGCWLYRVTHDDPRAMFLFVLRETVTFDLLDPDLITARGSLR